MVEEEEEPEYGYGSVAAAVAAYSSVVARFLQAVAAADQDEDGAAAAAAAAVDSGRDGVVLRNTFRVYGSIMAVALLAFSYLRRKFPRAYNIRAWVPAHQTYLAQPPESSSSSSSSQGFFSWIWHHNKITDDEILRECGLDSLCFLRLLRMGCQMAVVCAVQSIYLIPIYRYASAPPPDTTHLFYSDDRVVQVTMAHVPSASPKLLAAVVAAYCIFFYFMYLIHYEFDWFIEKRHTYLKLAQASNYTVHVRNVPPEVCTNVKLTQYFRKCLDDSAVYEVRLRIQTKQLMSVVQKRNALVAKLEHALNYEIIKGVPPKHLELKLTAPTMALLPGQRQRRKQQQQSSSSSSTPTAAGTTGELQLVDSVPTYAQQLREANREVTQRITAIEENNFNHNTNGMDLSVESFQSCDTNNNDDDDDNEEQYEVAETTEGMSTSRGGDDDDDDFTGHGHSSNSKGAVLSNNTNNDQDQSNNSKSVTGMLGQGAGLLANTAKSGVGILTQTTKNGVGLLANTAGTVAKTAAGALLGAGDDGQYMTAGFVSFRTLRHKNAALQMLHHAQPFTIEVVEAPEPDDIFWANVGRSHKDLQMGNLISRAGTTALCFLWTIPMAIISGLQSADAIGTKFPALSFLVKYDFVVVIIDLVAPLLVKIVNNLLPTILTYLTMFEGPVSSSVVATSLFTKLASFMVIQTFFVQAVGGSLIQEIKDIIKNPIDNIVPLLADALPKQSTFFVQIVFVGTTISLSLEMLRVTPLVMALIRRFLPPNLTEKEKQTTVFGIRPLADPSEFELASSLAQIILNFVIMLVYAVIAPLTVFIQGFCFLAMFVCYRHQFIYVYPKKPDSGGASWTNFIKIIMLCTLIAEITLMGYLGLKESALAAPFMLPLVIITVLFNGYMRQQHFRVAEFLPSRDCLKTDERNGESFDLSFLDDAFLQDELREKRALPENLPSQRAYDLGLVDQVGYLLASGGM